MSFSRLRVAFLSCVVVVLALGASTPAYAQFTVNITTDEFGNGSLTNSSGFSGALTSSFTTDSGPGGLNNVLTYNLLNPPGLVGGDLFLFEGEIRSEVLRFDPSVNGGVLFFYSDLDGGADAPADIGLPGAFNTNTFSLQEVALGGGLFGATYTPTTGQPGFVSRAGGPVTYTFISDVPEPSSILLMGSGLALPLLLRFRRKTAL